MDGCMDGRKGREKETGKKGNLVKILFLPSLFSWPEVILWKSINPHLLSNQLICIISHELQHLLNAQESSD